MGHVAFALILLLWPALSQADDLASLLHAQNWVEAEAAARREPDPIAPILVRWLRLLTRGAASADEIDRFLADQPTWPQRATLLQRYDEALLAEHDEQRARALCASRPPPGAGALLRCADLQARAGQDGSQAARAAWLTGIRDPAGETAFMRRWGQAITEDDQRTRFDRLAWTDPGTPGGPLSRQALRLQAAAQPMAQAALTLRRTEPTGPTLYAKLTADQQSDPLLVLDLLRWQRQSGHPADAAQGWIQHGAAAEAQAPPERHGAFWRERQTLIRALLQQHDDATAYALSLLPEQEPDALFLAGWIALRRMNQPDMACAHFRVLAATVNSAISQARAQYWLGRALAAAGHATEASEHYRLAATWPTTYYGQLASLALGEKMDALAARLRALTDPGWDEQRAIGVAASPFGRAAAMLTAWGERRRAKPFLLALDDDVSDGPSRAIVARYALALGVPDVAVAVARRAGLNGAMLPVLGWPEAAEPPADTVERAVALGLIRQESSFDADAGSPAGAQGLMQLMPSTAAAVAKKLGVSPTPLTDPDINLRLGSAYLASLLDRFGAIPPALAGYNAGPARTREWLTAIGDPAAGSVDPIDWVELIPISETRDYVQRVIENVVIYRARAGVALPHPVLQWASGSS